MFEIELKLQVPRPARTALRAAVATASARTTRLRAVYADTADRRLSKHGFALRLRQEDRLWVQTLKGRGDDLVHRLEHECPLSPQRGAPTLDPTRHAGTPVGDRLLALLADGAPLLPSYSTDIRRLHRRVRSGGAVVELAYDRGWIIAGDRRLAVDEIEFELKRGPPEALLALAQRWAQRHGLWWDLRSKSEQGYLLALGRQQMPPAPPRPGAPLVEQLVAAMRSACLLAGDLATDEHAAVLADAAVHVAAALRRRAPALAAAWRTLPAPRAGEGAPWRSPTFTTLALSTLGQIRPGGR